MNMADNALAGGDSGHEAMSDRMTGFILGDRRVDPFDEIVNRGVRGAGIAVLGPRPGVHRRPVVRIDHVARCAAAGPVIARVIVGAEKVQRRIEQPRLLQANEDRVGAVQRPQAAVAQTLPRLAVELQCFGNPDLGSKPAAPLEDAQDVSRLAVLEPRQRIEERQDSLLRGLFRSRGGNGLQPLRCPVHRIAFAIPRPLVGNSTVVIERRPPQHAAVSHHALAHFECLTRMTDAAAQMGHAQVTGIHEADEFRTFAVEHRVRTNRVRRRAPDIRISRMNVSLLFRGGVTVAAVTVDTAELKRHRAIGLLVRIARSLVARHATAALGRGHLRRLLQEIVLGNVPSRRVLSEHHSSRHVSSKHVPLTGQRDVAVFGAFNVWFEGSVRSRRRAAGGPDLVFGFHVAEERVWGFHRDGEHLDGHEHPQNDAGRDDHIAKRIPKLLTFNHEGILATFDARAPSLGLAPLRSCAICCVRERRLRAPRSGDCVSREAAAD